MSTNATLCDPTAMAEILLSEVHDDGSTRLEFVLTGHPTGRRAVLTATGHGTMEGAHAMVRFLDMALAAPGQGTSSALMRIGGVESTPIRAQFLLGKWLLKNKSRVGLVSVVGAKAWERKLATAVCAIASFKSLTFHQTESEGRAWLGWNE